MGQFFYFQNKLGHHLRHRHLHAVRIFADDAQEKWRPKFLKSFMLLAHNSTRLCLLEFCFSVFCCSSLNEIRQCRIQVCPALSLTKQCSASSFTRTSYHSTLNLIYVKDQQLFQFLTQLKASWVYLDIAAFQNFKVFLLMPHACEDFGRVFATEK